MILLKIDELSKYIKMSKSSIYKLCGSNEIPHIKRGSLLFDKAEIDKWLELYNVPANVQIVNNVSKLIKPIRNGNSI